MYDWVEISEESEALSGWSARLEWCFPDSLFVGPVLVIGGDPATSLEKRRFVNDTRNRSAMFLPTDTLVGGGVSSLLKQISIAHVD